jgi:hypothetical protein
MQYDAVGLQDAAAGHQELAAGIEPIISQLGRLVLDAGTVGLSPLATRFTAALDHARQTCSVAPARESWQG